jgi:cytochrome c biogenesis protein CcmG, thiol:disulfide interchange protein DsbE
MRTSLRIGQIAAVALVATLLGLLAWKLANGEGARATGRAPTFTLPRLDRPGSLSLTSLRGKAVVINFWASWCVPCRDEAPFLEAVWRKYRSRGLVVLGVDIRDFSNDARRFARRYGMTYPLVKDTGQVERQYGITGVPETFFVDRAGNLVGEAITGPVDGTDEIERRFSRWILEALEQTGAQGETATP